MESVNRLYEDKKLMAEEIAMQVKSGDIIATTCALGQAVGIIKAVSERARSENLKDITLHMLLTLEDMPYLHEPYSDHIHHVAWFTSGFARKPIKDARADFMPVFYKDVPRLWRQYVKANVFVASVSPMDEKGYFTFGPAVSTARAQMERADKVFLEVNENVPRVMGTEIVHISEVTNLCENNVALPQSGEVVYKEEDRLIGKLIADEIVDGATIQLGIGAMPNVLATFLTDKKHLGIHSEMYTESMVDLTLSGVVDNSKKSINKNMSVASFAFGTKKMYDFLNDNQGVCFRPIDYVNDPYVIGQLENFVSINSTLEVDLLGQVCSESVGSRQISGVGGQLDFVRGAWLSKGGKSFISLHSTAMKGAESTIKPILTPGAHVSCTKNDTDCIVTEYGIARLKGLSASQRAKALIAIAHPKFREELLNEAKKLNLMV